MTVPNPADLIEQRLKATHHFEWYVPPELSWEDPNPLSGDQPQGRPEETWKETSVQGENEQILIKALKETITEGLGRGIVLLGATGSGKTVLSFVCERLLADSSQREQVFGEPLPRLVLRWAKSNWPTPDARAQTLVDLIAADEALLGFCREKKFAGDASTVARSLAQYALQEGRVAIIIDAWDELEESQRISFRKVYQKAREEKASFFLLISSRDYAVNDEAGTFFLDDAFRRLRIQPFKTALQDRFMEKALSHMVADWRKECLGGNGEDWDKQLGIPLVLRQVAVMINAANAKSKPLPKFSSLSDLFVQSSQWMMKREFGHEKNEHIRKNLFGNKPLQLADCCDILERALGAIAFELSIRGIWKEVKGAVRGIGEILGSAKQRFERSCQEAFFQRDITKSWQWAQKRIGEFEINNGSLQADINSKVLSFTTRHVQEMRCARYLTHFATDSDLRDFVNPKYCALGHNGDLQWEDIWKGVIKMPVDFSVEQELEGYKRSLEVLFERPVDPKQRRPTYLMWICDQWIKSQERENRLTCELDRHLRHFFRAQFMGILYGEDKAAKPIAEDVIEVNNFVLLADQQNPRDSFDRGLLSHKSYGDVSLSRFQLCKYAVSNEQYWLFDDNFIDFEKDRESFGKPSQPAIFVSWFDAYWFCEFVVMRDKRTHVVLPSSAQSEYGARAGSGREFFRGEKGIEVTEHNLSDYAHYGQSIGVSMTLSVKGHGKKANAWGLEMMAGNVLEWCWDWFVEHLNTTQNNPLGPDFGSYRVCRGGSWSDDASDCCSAEPCWYPPSYRSSDFGFRLALSCPEIPE